MAQEENNDEQIKPEQFNMILLEFLVKNPIDYWNVNEIKETAGSKTLNYNRVKNSIIFFSNRKFVSAFSDLPPEQQKKHKRERSKPITSESYQINEYGKEIYKKIIESCLDPVGQRLLSFKKIE